MLRAASLVLLASLTSGALAARPFVTDDARVADNCQVESFLKRDHGNNRNELWVLPACRPVGPVEITVGARRIEAAGALESRAEMVQAKTLLRPLEANGTGFAFSIGATHEIPRPDPAAGAWTPSFTAIASHSFDGDRVVLHVNAGMTKDPQTRRHPRTWGVGAEIEMTSRIYGIAETYGQQEEPTSTQLGIRYWVVRDRWQVDGTSGRQRGSSWISVGFRVLF